MHHVDEQIELNQKENENKKERSIYTIIYKRKQFRLKIEIDHATLESLNQKREV